MYLYSTTCQYCVKMHRTNNFLIVAVHLFMLSVMLLTTAGDNFCSSNEIHALILARGGSKGIKYKNLISIDGVPILSRTIITIQNSGVFSCIWVSTDSEKIANEALKYGALVHNRSNAFAHDETSSLESVKEFLISHRTIRNFALFQCTSPFLKTKYILEAIWKFQKSDCVFSVTRTYKLRWKNIDGSVLPINFDPSRRPRRQDWSGELEENGMFYFSTKELIERNVFQNDRCAIVEIDPFHSKDLDTFDDVLLSRCLNFIEKKSPTSSKRLL